MTDRPKVENAPGVTWKPKKHGWEARWQCRTDLAERGFTPRVIRIWQGWEPNEIETAYIQDRCTDYQSQMLAWSKGGVPVVATFDGSLRNLIECYRNDKDSKYRKLRYRTRKYYDALFCSILDLEWHDEDGLLRTGASTKIAEIKARLLLRWHEIYFQDGRVSMGHSIMGMLRMLSNFGLTILEDAECARLSAILSKMEFAIAKPRTEILTAEMATRVRAECHKIDRASIALAQAFQFDGMLRQKDAVGEYVPLNETNVPLTDIIVGNNKWIRGLRWETIDDNLILTHITSKRQKKVELNLRLMPMVMAELGNPTSRDQLPKSGPMIVSEVSRVPWFAAEFRKEWRKAATAGGIPKTVRSMDSRAGAITEATEAGAPLESIKHAATHSDIAMTQRYARGAEEKTAEVMKQRVEHRNKTGS